MAQAQDVEKRSHHTAEQHREYMRLYMRAWNARRRAELGLPVYVHDWLQQAILRVLSAHPDGLRVKEIRAKLGYHSSIDTIRRTVHNLRRRKGWTILLIKEGWFTRYVLVARLDS